VGLGITPLQGLVSSNIKNPQGKFPVVMYSALSGLDIPAKAKIL